MNIFNYTGKGFDKKLDEIFKNKDKEELKQELIECGLEVNINNPKDIQEILIALDDTTKEQLDKAIENADKEWSEMEMEEDIKVLEDYAYAICTISCTTEKDKRIAQAIENLIKRNKELEDKEKNWNKIYDEDQEHITELNNQIFQLEISNKKLDKENQGLFELYNFNDTSLLAKILKDYRKIIKESIPKSKVREKIEKYESKLKQPTIQNINTAAYGYYLGKKEGWEELLQEGDDK